MTLALLNDDNPLSILQRPSKPNQMRESKSIEAPLLTSYVMVHVQQPQTRAYIHTHISAHALIPTPVHLHTVTDTVCV